MVDVALLHFLLVAGGRLRFEMESLPSRLPSQR